MRRSLIALLPCLLGFAAAGEGDPFGFLPDGGRGLFARAFPDHAAQEAALAETRGEADWAAALVGAGLTDRERATLAAYLARIAPREGGADPVATLPPDGRDMAVAQCQSCHSLFSGYLMQRRDRQGWLAVFASPFHAAIPLAPGARAIFADYPAINLPLRLEDVPPELRF